MRIGVNALVTYFSFRSSALTHHRSNQTHVRIHTRQLEPSFTFTPASCGLHVVVFQLPRKTEFFLVCTQTASELIFKSLYISMDEGSSLSITIS
jgi:hypothetical protein